MDDETAKLAAWIQRKKGGVASPREVVAGVRAFREGGVADAQAAMERIVNAGWGSWRYVSGGRKQVLQMHRTEPKHGGVFVPKPEARHGQRGWQLHKCRLMELGETCK